MYTPTTTRARGGRRNPTLLVRPTPKTKPKTSSILHLHPIIRSTTLSTIHRHRHHTPPLLSLLHQAKAPTSSSTQSTRRVTRHYYSRHHRFAAMPTLEGATRTAFLLFFISHIPITLVIDGQAFFPRHYYPQVLRDVVDWYAITFKVRIRFYFLTDIRPLYGICRLRDH